MEIQGYTLLNKEKVERALNGTPHGDSTRIGGIGNGAYFDTTENVWKIGSEPISEDAVNALEVSLLAEYDKLGGAIYRGSDKVKMGSFFDFKAKKARIKPDVVFEFRINDKVVEVKDGVELPGIVKAAKILAESETEVEEGDKPKKKKGKK